MSVDEARRLLLHDAARDAWGAEAALVLMEMLPADGQRRSIQWNVATIIAAVGLVLAAARLG